MATSHPSATCSILLGGGVSLKMSVSDLFYLSRTCCHVVSLDAALAQFKTLEMMTI